MIVVAGYMTIDPAWLTAFEEAIAATVDTVRKEDGCQHFSMLAEDRSRGLINVSEVWRDEAALRTHLAQPSTTELFARVSPHIKSRDTSVYDVVRSIKLTP